MRSFSRLALLLGAASLAIASDVHDLKADTFDAFMDEHDLVLAEFFAPWCGHCKALAPEYEAAATTLKDKKIKLIKVDCTVEDKLCGRFEVQGFPTLKVFRGKDDHQPYKGQRKTDSIVSYMIKQSLPAISILENKEKFDEFKSSGKIVVISFAEPGHKTANETFTAAADKHRDDYFFGVVHDPEVAKAEEVKQPAVVLYKDFDEPKVVYDGELDTEALIKFIKTSSVPLVGEVGPETYSEYMASGLPLAYIFAETKEERDTLAAELKPLAEKHRGKINFATIDAQAFGAHGENLNLKVGQWPAFAIQRTSNNEKYPFDQTKKISHDEIAPFVNDFVAEKLKPSIKSEPIPESQDGPVTVVVAHNYKDVVVDNEKDVLLEFYAPWCGHCKALAPKWDELGALYKNDPELAKLVTIAKVDATANDVPEEIQGFPTIKLFPAGKKTEPIEFNGSRDVADFVKFIKENGSHKASATIPVTEEEETKEETKAEDVKEEPKEETEEPEATKETATPDVHDEL